MTVDEFIDYLQCEKSDGRIKGTDRLIGEWAEESGSVEGVSEISPGNLLLTIDTSPGRGLY